MIENSVIDRTKKPLILGITLLLIAIILFWASSVIKKPSLSQKEIFTVEVYQGSVGEGFAYSSLYPPTQLEAKNITSSSITITWNFEGKSLKAKPGLDSEYADHSGFRIYRDDYWYTDVPSSQTSITDTTLFPGESYKYRVVALTFDNKVEGKPSEEIEIITLTGDPNPIINLVKDHYRALLVEGASVAEGQRLTPGLAFGNQVAEYLIKNGSENLLYFNRAVSGSFTAEVADRIGREIEELNDREGLSPDLVIVDTAGINYLAASGTLLASARGNHSMLAFRKNVEDIIREVEPSDERTLILININYFSCCKNKDEDSVENNHKRRTAWNKMVRDIANKHGLILVDVEKAMVESGRDDSYLLADSLHPSYRGHIIIANAIIDEIEKYQK